MKKIYGVLFGIACFSLTLTGCDYFEMAFNKLDAPTNVQYDFETFTLSWEVEKSQKLEDIQGFEWQIKINGEEITNIPDGYNEERNVYYGDYYYIPEKQETKFEVKGSAFKGYKMMRTKSAKYTYTLDNKHDINRAEIYRFVHNLRDKEEIEKIISIVPTESTSESTYALKISLVSKYYGKYFVKYYYDHEITSLSQIMENNDYKSMNEWSHHYCENYDTAKHYLKRTNLVGTLQQYKEAGYTITCLSSQTYRSKALSLPNDADIGVDGVYKVELGSDVRYFSVDTIFDVERSPDSLEEASYTTKVEELSTGKLYEMSCDELTGDFLANYDYYK